MRGAIHIGLLGGLLACSAARGGAVYTVTDLGDLGGNDSAALGLNEAAKAVGRSQTIAAVDHGFWYPVATMQELDSIAGCDEFCRAEAHAINANDEMAGWADFPPLFKNATYWKSGGSVWAIISPTHTGESAAYDLTDDQNLRIVGGADLVPGGMRHAFRWTDANDNDTVEPGEWENLGVLDDVVDPELCVECHSEARGVNADGDVVGWSDICDCDVPGDPMLRQAFFWENGVMQGLSTSWGSSEAYAVNDFDVAVGWRHNSNLEERGARWEGNGTTTFVPLSGGTNARCLDINNCNQIVGWSDSGSGRRAVIWQKPDLWVIADLNTLIDPALGWTLQAATGINENGSISGYGTLNGDPRAFLLRPTWSRMAVDPICPCSYDEDGQDCDDSECSDDLLHFSNVTSDVTRLADGGRPVIGMASDGVSRVVLRVEVPGPGTVDFEVGDDIGSPTSPERGGTLFTIDGVESFTVLNGVEVESIGDGRYMAFAVHVSPRDFVRDHPSVDDESSEWRPLFVTIEYTPLCGSSPSPAQMELQLHRTPVMLLHGWLSEAAAFEWDMRYDSRFTVFSHDYSRTNSEAWAVNLGMSGGGRNEPKAGARNAIFKLRDQDIAAVQVDVVAHSMGGVLSRLHAADVAGDYTEPYNYGQGDFHKLVTANTPHKGMSLTCLIGTNCGCLAEMVLGPPDGAMLDFSLQGTFAQSVGGSIPAVSSVPCHAIVGETGNNIVDDADALCGPGWFDYLPGATLVGWFHDECTEFFQQYRNLMLNEEHDLFVPVSSQRGGLTAATTPVDRPDFRDSAGTHVGVNDHQQISVVVVDLLQTDAVVGPDWEDLPSVSSNDLPTCGNWCFIDTDLCNESAGPFNLQIVAPVEVAAGSNIGIGLIADFFPTSVIVWSEHGRRWFNRAHCILFDCSQINTDLPAPDDAFGPMVISAVAFNDDVMVGARATDVTINIVPPPATTLDAFRFVPDRAYLHDFADEYLVDVVGTFSDGVDRVMSGSARGTIYGSTDLTVASISCDGLVVAHGVGETTLVAQNIYDGGTTVALGSVRVVSTGPIPQPPPVFADCNLNSFDDSCEIALGFAEDLDLNGVPDACDPDPCPWDCDGSGDDVVGITDFLTLLGQWTQVGTSCDFGVGGDGVGINEFLDLLAHWGPCP